MAACAIGKKAVRITEKKAGKAVITVKVTTKKKKVKTIRYTVTVKRRKSTDKKDSDDKPVPKRPEPEQPADAKPKYNYELKIMNSQDKNLYNDSKVVIYVKPTIRTPIHSKQTAEQAGW